MSFQIHGQKAGTNPRLLKDFTTCSLGNDGEDEAVRGSQPAPPERNAPRGDLLELLLPLCPDHSYSGKYPVKTTLHAVSHVRVRLFYPF